MSNFSEDYILFMNPNLKQEDLKLLNIIHQKYNILCLKERLLSEKSLATLLSYIILNAVPYNVGVRLVMSDGKLFSNLVQVSGNKLTALGSHYGQSFIDHEIKKINKILNES